MVRLTVYIVDRHNLTRSLGTGIVEAFAGRRQIDERLQQLPR